MSYLETATAPSKLKSRLIFLTIFLAVFTTYSLVRTKQKTIGQ